MTIKISRNLEQETIPLIPKKRAGDKKT